VVHGLVFRGNDSNRDQGDIACNRSKSQ